MILLQGSMSVLQYIGSILLNGRRRETMNVKFRTDELCEIRVGCSVQCAQ